MKVGLDISSKGYFVIMNGNTIYDMCQVPQKNDVGYYDAMRVYGWLSCHKKNIEKVIIEQPLMQTANPTTIMAISSMFKMLGIIICLLDLLCIDYELVSVGTWRKKYNYKKLSKDDTAFILKNKQKGTKKTAGQVKREFAKLESIRIAEELVPNIKDWYIPPRCRVINDDIVESALIGMY